MGNSYHLACWREDVGAVSKWLNGNYPLSFYLRPGVLGANAMHIAIYRGNPKVASLLKSFFAPQDPWSAANYIDPLMLQILQLRGNEELDDFLLRLSSQFDYCCFGIFKYYEYLSILKVVNFLMFHKEPENHGDMMLLRQYNEFGPNAPVQGAPAHCAHFTPLRVAILMLDDNVQLIERLAVGADLEMVDSKGHTVLHIAARRSTVDVVKILLQAGSSLSAVNAANMTPYSCAVIRGSLPVLQAITCSSQFCVRDARLDNASFIVAASNHFHLLVFLLKLGADINSTNHDVLMRAAVSDNVTYLEKLLENGAYVHDAIVSDELTALHWAAVMSSPGVIPLLIEAGLPVDVLDELGNTPLQSALGLCNSQSTVPCLIKCGANINFKSKRFSNGNYFHVLVCSLHSCNRGTLSLHIPQLSHFQLLQSLGCDLYCPDDLGRLPIHLAAMLDLPKGMEYILGCGFPLNTPIKTEAGLFPIHVAACHDSVDVIEYLSELDRTFVNMLSLRYHVSPLMFAVRNKAVLACKRLLELGAISTVCDDYGFTAMHHTAMACPELVDTLAQHGCSVDIDSDNQSPRLPQWFVSFRPLFSRSFLRHSFKPIHLAAATGSVEGLKRLLQLGAQANALCSNAAPIHLASTVGNAQCVALLLQHGADSNFPGPLGFTALHLAALFGKIEAVRILVSKGCSVLCRTSTANGVGHLTPLHCAALFRQPAALEALLSLPDPGINCLTADGMSALLLAILPIHYKISALPASPQPDVKPSTAVSTSCPKQSKHDNEALETVVSLLLAKGCNVNTRNSNGHTAYDFAQLYYLDHVKPLLKQAGAKSSHELVPTNHAQGLQELKEVSAKLDQYISDASQLGEFVSGIGQVADEYRRTAQDNADEKKHAVSSARDLKNQQLPQRWNDASSETAAIKSLLQDVYDVFMSSVDAKQVSEELRRKKVIPESTSTRIERAADCRKANGCLFDHLQQQSTIETLLTACHVLMSQDGFTRMNEFGKKLKKLLEVLVSKYISQ